MFRVVAIAGSPNSVGLMHEEIEWRLESHRPRYDILICSMSDIPDVDIAFSALPNNVAEVVEPSLVARGIHVFSNASTFRRIAGIPLVIPEVNPEDMHSYDGHACATNCTVVPSHSDYRFEIPWNCPSQSHTPSPQAQDGGCCMTKKPSPVMSIP